jgi:hypothetical protein
VKLFPATSAVRELHSQPRGPIFQEKSFLIFNGVMTARLAAIYLHPLEGYRSAMKFRLETLVIALFLVGSIGLLAWFSISSHVS